MREEIDRRSEQEGRNSSRLPEFDTHWSEYIRGKFCFALKMQLKLDSTLLISNNQQAHLTFWE